MRAEYWYILLGALLAGIASTGSLIKRLPLTTAMVYFVVGLALGSQFFGVIVLDPRRDANFLERISEAAVLVSLFTAGLKLRAPWPSHEWNLAVRLAFGSMVASVVLGAVAGHVILGLSLAPSLLLAAMLAPTDPVLASEVQLSSPFERDRFRFSLTGEAGLNDGTAFPFLVLGLALLAGSTPQAVIGRWFLVDALYPVVAGFAFGATAGTLFGRYVLHLRVVHGEALGYNDFLALGLMAVTYGAAQLLHVNGFLAVFAAGYALRLLEMRGQPGRQEADIVLPIAEEQRNEVATSAEQGPVYLTETVRVFNEHYERMAEFALVIVFGALAGVADWSGRIVVFIAVLFLVVRPVAVLPWLAGSRLNRRERALIGWFGLRGIGSLYYLSYALSHGLEGAEARLLMSAVLCTGGASIFVHGLSVSPLLRLLRPGNG